MSRNPTPADNCLRNGGTRPQGRNSSGIPASLGVLSTRRGLKDEPSDETCLWTVKLSSPRANDKFRNIRGWKHIDESLNSRHASFRIDDPFFLETAKCPSLSFFFFLYEINRRCSERWPTKFSKATRRFTGRRGELCQGESRPDQTCRILLVDQMEARIQRFPGRVHTLLGLSTEDPECPEGVFSPTFRRRCCENIWPRFKKISRPGNSRPAGSVYSTLSENSMQHGTRFLFGSSVLCSFASKL